MKARAKLVAVILGCLCVLSLASLFLETPEVVAQETPEVREYLDLGVKLYAQGRYRDALSQFNRVLVIEPENKIAKKYVEECAEYLQPSAVEEVTVEYPEKVAPPPVPVGPSPEEVRRAAVEKYLGFGRDYFDKEQYDKAVEEWERVLLIDPTNVRAIRSIREAERRSIGEKREDIKEALELQRQDNSLQTEQKLFRPAGSNIDGIKPFRITLPPVEKREVRPIITKMEKILETLETKVNIDFAEGTDIRDVITFLSDFVGVNIVLDERVMFPPALPMAAPGTPGMEMVGGPAGFPVGLGPAPGFLAAGPAFPGAGPAGLGVGQIVPNIAGEVRRIYLKDIPLKDALKAMLSQMGLSYKVQPEFVWVSRPDILRQESFEPLETRYYLLQNAGGESLPKVAMTTVGG
ncbi:MAG: hypothetical protein KAJ01_00330, partial [Candidatus Hydrogenedentes bacterium]|nr:hypothetical protein [Candidatus Hydrogenedentota bacterium]